MTTPTYQLKHIANGAQGIRQTLRLMSKITKHYKKSRYVRELALNILANVPQKQWGKEVQAIYEYVRDNIRYVRDIRGCETLQTPVQTLRIGQGDCDDQSILVASLLESAGHPTRFVAVGFKPGTYSHVFAQTKIGNKWISLECTMEGWQVGQTPRKIKSKMIEHN